MSTETVELRAAMPAQMWFIVAEDGGPNTAIFTATDLNDESILKIADDAKRGSAATIDYDGTTTGIQVQFSEATIDIQSPDDVWTSGLSIPIVVVDDDMNKNSLSGDDIVLSDPNSIVPTLVTGDPFTLGEVSRDRPVTTWLGWEDNVNAGMATALLQREASTTTSTYGDDNEDNPFTIKGFGADGDRG